MFQRWKTRNQSQLLPPAQIQRALERERARADRLDGGFSLLIFELPAQGSEPSDYSLLINVLLERLRISDEIGWTDDGRLAVVLLDTAGDGAWVVADDVISAYSPDEDPPHCTVFTYPSDAPSEGLSRSRTGRLRQRPVQRMEELFIRPLPAWKRALDVAVSAAALMVAAPMLGAIAVAVRLDSPGPAIYRQRRAGLGGAPFTMLKFRTMRVGADAEQARLRNASEQDGPAFKMSADPRVTRLGRWLRKTSLDELPQLWNVLRGEMSLVGPRPLPCEESSACCRWHRRRLDVTPGLTCFWQTRGRSRVSFDRWMRMDLRYVRSRTLLLDLRLLKETVPAILHRRGAK
jgi:lipopolysaccharide/colanic/teichoic acid biosynthesis glycosyltransferase